MPMIRATAIRLLSAAALCALAPLAYATPILTGTATVALNDSLPPPISASQGVTIAAGHEIDGAGDSGVSQWLFDAEYIDFDHAGLSITYRIEGGGGAYVGSDPSCPVNACKLWDYASSDAHITFSGLTFSPGASLTGVNLVATDVFGATISGVTANSFVLNFGSAGITVSPSNLGTLVMNLQVGAAAVPLPSSLWLLVSACLGLVLLLRRRACNDVSF